MTHRLPRLLATVAIMAACSTSALAASKLKSARATAPAPTPYAEAVLRDATGKIAGKVTLLPEGHMLEGSISVTGGLTPGQHGMHIHTIGKCTGPDFASAGGHLNPEGKQHGLENPLGAHEGDLPMLTADANGAGSLDFTAHSSFDALFDADGSAFVIHAAPDDMKTDPTGNSGARVLCGVFEKKSG
jgi:Cu-Zn family superoxide dismutase